jgi:DNA-binding CsgD family transcriptional regulator
VASEASAELKSGAGKPADHSLITVHLHSLTLRLVLAAVLIGLPYGMMSNFFLSLSEDQPYRDLSLILGCGLVVLVLLLLLVRLIRKEPDPLVAFPFVIITVFPAFFPFNIGGTIGGLIALYGTAFSFVIVIGTLMMVRFKLTETIPRLETYLKGSAFIGFFTGFLLGVVFAASIHRSVSLLSSDMGIALLSLCGLLSIISVFVATNILISREMLRNAQMVAANVLPVSYTVYREVGETDEAQGFIDACRTIALQRGLTQREVEVMSILAKGHVLARVQETLFLSEGTAITHRNNLYKKLAIHSKQELIDYVEAVRVTHISVQ